MALPQISDGGQNGNSNGESSQQNNNSNNNNDNNNNNNNNNNNGISVIIGENARVDKNVTANFAASKEVDSFKAGLLTQLKSTPTAPGGKIDVKLMGDAHVGDNFVANTIVF